VFLYLLLSYMLFQHFSFMVPILYIQIMYNVYKSLTTISMIFVYFTRFFLAWEVAKPVSLLIFSGLLIQFKIFINLNFVLPVRFLALCRFSNPCRQDREKQLDPANFPDSCCTAYVRSLSAVAGQTNVGRSREQDFTGKCDRTFCFACAAGVCSALLCFLPSFLLPRNTFFSVWLAIFRDWPGSKWKQLDKIHGARQYRE
jgi:hypothetical protein